MSRFDRQVGRLTIGTSGHLNCDSGRRRPGGTVGDSFEPDWTLRRAHHLSQPGLRMQSRWMLTLLGVRSGYQWQRAMFTHFGRRIEGVRLKTGHGGIFEIRVDDDTIYDQIRGYDLDAIIESIEERIAA